MTHTVALFSVHPDATGELVWLKLRSSQVFWPACIFDGYSEAVSNSLDPSALRNVRPVLAHDEHVVYFFGVGPCGCFVRSATGPAPTLQLCVARADDMIRVPFTGEHDQFAQLCREHHISNDLVERAENNACFQRGRDEALAYKLSVLNASEASTYFLTLLASTKQAARSSTRSLVRASQDAAAVIGAEAQKTSAAASPSRAAAAADNSSLTGAAAPLPPQFCSPPHVKLARALLSSPSPSKKVLEGLEHVAATFWSHMLACGWQTLTQSDAVTLYKKPGVSFFDLRPNENVFDSLVKAFNAYVSDWAQSLASSSADADTDAAATNARLMDALWPLVEQSGWTKITTANETWYVMPDTPFNACVPNVTIFQSKAEVVTKFLAQAGILEPSSSGAAAAVKNLAMDIDDDESVADGDDCDHELNESGASSAEEDAGDDSDDTVGDEESGDDEVVAVAPPTKPAKASVRAKQPKTKAKTAMTAKTMAAPAKQLKTAAKTTPVAVSAAAMTSSAAKKLTFESTPRVPPFKCTFGKVEGELRARGWFWKPSQFGWTYFMPHCRGQDKRALAAGDDYFDGQCALEEYLKDSGEYDEIYETLERAHHARYTKNAGDDSDDASEDDAPLATSKKPVARKPVAAVATPTTARTSDADKENRSSNIVARTAKQPLAKPSARPKRSARSAASSAIDTASVKFGEIWAVLEQQGWHFKQGKFEYDYFPPTCCDASAGVATVDYFVSKSMLIDHLKASGIWNKVAQQVAHEAAMDLTSSDNDDDDGNNDKVDKRAAQTPSPAVKSPVANRQALKRRSNGLSERKSPAAVRSSSNRNGGAAVDDEETPKTKPASKKMRVSGSFRTPPEHKRSADIDAVENDGHESDNVAADKISPDASSQRTTAAVAAAHDSSSSSGSNLPRKLADCFTPSPGQTKKSKSQQPTGPLTRFTDAIQRLALGYTVPRFEHRDDETQRVLAFFQTCFTQRHGASMYISGAPGCGKSALLKASEPRIAELYQEAYGVKDTKLLVRCHVNAMALADANNLFCDLASKLTAQAFDDGECAFEAIERATSTATKRCKTMVLVLDEIDILLKKNGVERDLCRLFELAHRESHAFILVGIANQVDFTERHLPLLTQQLPTCKPEVVIFKPYAHATIEQILTERLGGRDMALQMLNAHGISFLARKIASTSGDIRLALDICRRVLQHRVDAAANASATGDVDESLLLTPVPLTDMLRLVKASLESKSAQVVQSLPRTLQMILFASTRLVASSLGPPSALSGSAGTAMTASGSDAGGNAGALFALDELYACYCDVSHEAGVFKPLTFREFKRALETLGSEGLLGAAELKKQLVKLLFAPSELLQGFRNDAYFARLV